MAATRTVVTIGQRRGKLSAWLEKAALNLPNARDPITLNYDVGALPAMDSLETTRAYGTAIAAGLMRHKAIKHVLDTLFVAGTGDAQSLHFSIEAADVEDIRWETLCDPGGKFLALNGRCHIGRIAEQTSSREGSVRAFKPPLRIAAFLSGAGVQAVQEWQALSQAVAKAASLMPVQATVFLGEPALLEQARADVLAMGKPAIRVEPMPASAVELQATLGSLDAHIVHFFCHGSAGLGAQFLELATLADQAAGADTGSVKLSIEELATLPALAGVWIVVLNCCNGAQAGQQLYSMAYQLVSEGGVAAAIGMHEPVQVGEASTFCAALYPELFSALKDALLAPRGGLPVAVNLSQAMTLPRQALRNIYPDAMANGRWTLPVLYLQERPLEIVVPVPPPAPPDPGLRYIVNPEPEDEAFRPRGMRGHQLPPVAWPTTFTDDELQAISTKADITSGLLRSLPPDAPGELRDRVLATLDERPVVPASMRPDRFGNVGSTG